MCGMKPRDQLPLMSAGATRVWVQWLVEYTTELERRLEILETKLEKPQAKDPNGCDARIHLNATGERLTCCLSQLHTSQGHVTPGGKYWQAEAVQASNSGGEG
jgi:hypothetical protein